METFIEDATFNGQPTKAVVTVLGEYPDVFTDTVLILLLVYVGNCLFRKEVLKGMGPRKDMKPIVKSKVKISSNIVCKAWDSLLNQ